MANNNDPTARGLPSIQKWANECEADSPWSPKLQVLNLPGRDSRTVVLSPGSSLVVDWSSIDIGGNGQDGCLDTHEGESDSRKDQANKGELDDRERSSKATSQGD